MSESRKRPRDSVLSAVLGGLTWAMIGLLNLLGDTASAFEPFAIPLSFVLAPAAILLGIQAIAKKDLQRGFAVVGILLGLAYCGVLGLAMAALSGMGL